MGDTRGERGRTKCIGIQGKGMYLSSADGVLSGSASDVVDFVFLD